MNRNVEATRKRMTNNQWIKYPEKNLYVDQQKIPTVPITHKKTACQHRTLTSTRIDI